MEKKQFEAIMNEFTQMKGKTSEYDNKFETIMNEFAQMKEKTNEHDEQFKAIIQKLKQIDSKFEQNDERFNQINKRFDRNDERLDKHDEQFKELKEELRNMDYKFSSFFMELNSKIDEQQEMNSRQYGNIYSLIEKRFQEGKKDREDLRSGQNALKFLWDQTNQNV